LNRFQDFDQKQWNEMQPNRFEENDDKHKWHLQRSNDGLQETAKSMDLKSNELQSNESLKYHI
jgi:hypothetical protein